MTTPQLEKAAQVIESLEREGYRFLDELSGHDESTLIFYIAQAITKAENDKLEDAAIAMERSADRYISEAGSTDYDEDVNQLRELAGLTRSLKSKVD